MDFSFEIERVGASGDSASACGCNMDSMLHHVLDSIAAGEWIRVVCESTQQRWSFHCNAEKLGFVTGMDLILDGREIARRTARMTPREIESFRGAWNHGLNYRRLDIR